MHLVKFLVNGQLLTSQNQRTQISGQQAMSTDTGNRINYGFCREKKKKTSCTVANSGVRRKKKLYGGNNA